MATVGQAAGVATQVVEAAAQPAAAAVADGAAPVVIAATRGMSGTGWLGIGAGAAGMAITLLDAWKQSFGSGRSFTTDSVVNPSTISIGGGAMLLTIGEKMAGTNAFMRNGLRGAGIALVLGGLAGAIAGVVHTFGNPLGEQVEANTSSQSQAPSRFGTQLPPTPANLAGVEVASANVTTTNRTAERISMYVDPSTATALPEDASLADAIGAARAATQSDGSSFRSHAVVQTEDGAYWVMRLSGDLDQVDGRKFTDGNDFDERYEPQIGRRQQALQAIAGVEGYYAFPESIEATAPDRYPTDIPWVEPTLEDPKDTKPATTATKPTDTTAKAED